MAAERTTLKSLAQAFGDHAAADVESFREIGKRLGRIEGAAWVGAASAISLLLAVIGFLLVRYVLPPEKIYLEPAQAAAFQALNRTP